MNEQELNMKAARMCGHDAAASVTGRVGVALNCIEEMSGYSFEKDNVLYREFNLDTSAADREATVIAPGERHSIAITPLQCSYSCLWVCSRGMQSYPTHKEALYAAVEAAPDGGE